MLILQTRQFALKT